MAKIFCGYFMTITLSTIICSCADDDESTDTGADGDTDTDTDTDTPTDTDTNTNGELCGGITGAVCTITDWCDYDVNNCGPDDQGGRCRERPSECPDIFLPVCACDGNTYSNACEAQRAGFDLNDNGGCAPPDNTMFGCGSGFCLLASSFCYHYSPKVKEIDEIFGCQDFPSSCGATPFCSCLLHPGCGGDCTGDAATGLTLTCTGL